MKKALLVVGFGFGVFACAAAPEEGLGQDTGALASLPSDKFLDHEEAVPGEFIVVLGKSLDRSSRVALAAQYNARVFHQYDTVINGFAARMTDEDAARIAQDPAVRFIERNGIKHTSETQANATWGIDRTDQRDLPLDRTYNWTLTGAGVNAVVIDTGVDKNHPDFEGRVAQGFNALTTGAPEDASDVHGHGSHVGGTMGSKTWGLAKGTTIVPVRVCDARGRCTDADIIRAVEWVTANVAKPAVVNMSLGGPASGAPTATEQAISASVASGITYVVAAGNSNRDACTFSPARLPEVITVGASTNADARSSFSNWGTCLDVFAPGSSITSVRRNSTGSTTMDGTSMASPHVAGVVALLLQAHPEATPAEMEEMIRSTSTPDKIRNPGNGSPNRLLHIAQ